MSFRYSHRDTTERERSLQREIDDLHDRQDRQAREHRRQEQEAWERRKQEAHETYESNVRHADNWPEAFRTQQLLCRRELSNGEDLDSDKFFTNTANACEKALEIWGAVTATKQGAITDLEKQLAILHDSIRREVADRLEAENPSREFAEVASQIRADQVDLFLDW